MAKKFGKICGLAKTEAQKLEKIAIKEVIITYTSQKKSYRITLDAIRDIMRRI